jgi:tetratricopeptide (TPR) repeat protein
MNAIETTPAASRLSRRGRPYFPIFLTVLGFALLGGAGYRYWRKQRMPEPPVVDLGGLDAEIIEAVRAAQTAVREQPHSPEAWGRLGLVLRAHEFNDPGNFCFLQAETLDPKDPRWPYLLSIQLLANDREAGVSLLRRAVQLAGDAAVPRMRLAEVLLDGGELDEAETLFQGILDKTPDEARAHLGMGQIALRRNDTDRALDHLGRALRGAPKAKMVHLALAQTHRLRGDDKAAEDESRIVANLPEDWNWPDPVAQLPRQFWTGLRARMTQIDAFDKRGAREEAVVAARQAVRRYPDSPLVYLVLGEMLNRSKNFAAAEPALREAIRRDPQRAKAHFELGYALQAKGQTRQAVESYRRTLELQPDFAVAHYNLALCLIGLQDTSGGERAFRAALRFRPEYPDALMALAVLLGRLDRAEEGLTFARQAARTALPEDGRAKALLKELDEKIAKKKTEKKTAKE